MKIFLLLILFLSSCISSSDNKDIATTEAFPLLSSKEIKQEENFINKDYDLLANEQYRQSLSLIDNFLRENNKSAFLFFENQRKAPFDIKELPRLNTEQLRCYGFNKGRKGAIIHKMEKQKLICQIKEKRLFCSGRWNYVTIDRLYQENYLFFLSKKKCLEKKEMMIESSKKS